MVPKLLTMSLALGSLVGKGASGKTINHTNFNMHWYQSVFWGETSRPEGGRPQLQKIRDFWDIKLHILKFGANFQILNIIYLDYK